MAQSPPHKSRGAAQRSGQLFQNKSGTGEAVELEEAEYRQHLVARAVELMQAEFEPATWQACWMLTALDRPAAEVADKLGVSVNAVYLAKSRVLARLRRELEGLLD